MTALSTLTLSAAAEQIRTGQVSPVDLVRACLERIDRLESRLQAWVTLDRDGALAAARYHEAEIQRGVYRGPLHGIPLGLKDIFYTAGLKTTMGSPIYADFVPDYDATVVQFLKEAGAVILGKCQTTEFAALAPSPTRNPWNLEHTPGGSSSGSAAAVAASMCYGALGSQTYGSTIRPAAYCGCVGLKPTYGRVSTFGMFALAWSLDHVGIFARTVTDVAHLLQVLAGDDPRDPACVPLPVPDYVRGLDAAQPPRLGLVRKFFWEKADEETRKHTEAVAARLARAGARVEEVQLPASFAGVPEAHFAMLYAESAASHRELYAQHKARYSPQMQELVEKGLTVSGIDYVALRRHQQRFRHDLDALCRTVDALLTPATPAPAPRGFATTGDPTFNGPASFSGLPSLGLPSGLSADGLPLGIQLVSAAFAEERLLAVGKWCEAVLDFRQTPPLG
ncbi:MAG: amidase [Candidatus Binatia bacterium]|nr:amidase [Candidatus Binatia bacterium]